MGQLVISLLLLSIISAGLALLLEIAHRYIADYGEVKILINNEKELEVSGGGPLLFTLMDQGIFIPSACGGRGTCAYCKVKVDEGGGPVLPTETPYLTAEEQDDNVRLSCQVKVRNDIKIRIPEELFLVKEFKTKVVEIEPLTPAINSLAVEIIAPEEGVKFKPGQYMQIQAPAFEMNKEPDFRAFSIASSAAEPKMLKFMITRAPEGLVSIYLHDYMKVGNELVMRGPFGDFYLRDSDREAILVATGSGLAPIRSILYQFETQSLKRKARLFFGARTVKDLIHYDELKDLEGKLHDFSFTAILSDPQEEDQWDGETGLITRLIQEHISENADIEAYICGSPVVVNACEKAFLDKGVPVEQIFYDKFA